MKTHDLRLHSPWPEVKEKLKEVHTELTDEDLEYEPGQERELVERVARRIKKDVPHTKAWIESVAYNEGIAS